LLEVHVLASGSDGNCTVIKNDDEAVMFDAGYNCKTLCSLMALEGIDPASIKAVLVTHEHTDHVSAIRVLNNKFGYEVYTTPATFDAFDHGNAKLNPIVSGGTFEVAGMTVRSLPTSHDAVDPTAYSFTVDGKTVSIITDTGVLTKPCQEALRISDLAILEANYDAQMLTDNPLYPPALKSRIRSDRGHLCNTDSGRFVAQTLSPRQRKLFLAHLSRKNNTPDIAKDTVSKLSGIPRFKIDCLEWKGDTRTIRL